MPSSKPSTIYDFVKEVRARSKNIDYHLSLLGMEGVDKESIYTTIERNTEEIGSALNSIERLLGVSQAKDEICDCYGIYDGNWKEKMEKEK